MYNTRTFPGRSGYTVGGDFGRPLFLGTLPAPGPFSFLFLCFWALCRNRAPSDHQAKKHPRLILLFVFIGAGGTGAVLSVMCLAVFNPDVCWDKKNNPEPWNKLGFNEQYEFYSVNVDYCKLKKEDPEF